MVLKVFSRKVHKLQPPSAAVPAGLRVYAVGDIHGRLDLLDLLIAQIEVDDRGRRGADTLLIFLGDLIDRGPDSAGVLQRVIELSCRFSVRLLVGNHEEVFLRALEGDMKALRFFSRIGGEETIQSYGMSHSVLQSATYGNLLDFLRNNVPQSHQDLLARGESMIVLGDYVFVHAGIHPSVPLNEQRLEHLRWIREDFLNHVGPLEKVVVHGHTVAHDVAITPYRIGLDTGAYESGLLTAMGFEDERRWVIQTMQASA